MIADGKAAVGKGKRSIADGGTGGEIGINKNCAKKTRNCAKKCGKRFAFSEKTCKIESAENANFLRFKERRGKDFVGSISRTAVLVLER